MRTLLAAALAAVTALCLAASAGAARPGTIHEFALGSSQRVYLFGLTTGSDGAIWFADLGCAGLGRCGIGRIDGSGRVSLYTRGLNAGSVPFQIALGPDGNLWFTDEGSRPAIGRVTPSGRITEFSRGLRRDSTPFAITLGPHYNLWFTSQGRHPAIGEITTRGRITLFSRGLRMGSSPFGIAAAGHGLWFTDHGCAGGGRCQLGRITAAGAISESRSGLRTDTDPLAMTAGFGGSVWFADGAGAIGEIRPDGQVTEHGLPAGSAPVGVAAGADGNIWFSDEGSHPVLGRIGPAGGVRTYTRGLYGGSLPAAIAPGPDGSLWFTDEGSVAAVGHVATGAPPTLTALAAPGGRARPGQTLSCPAASFAVWDQLTPAAPAFGFDGDRWLRDGVATGVRGPQYLVRARDAGHRLACRVIATYPSPFLTTAVGVSPAVTVRR